MNRQDKIIVAILVLALIASVYHTWNSAKKTAQFYREHPELAQRQLQENTVSQESPIEVEKPAVAERKDAYADVPETLVSVTNNVAVYTFSSHGASLKSVTLLEYDKTLNPEDGKVCMDFSSSGAMKLGGIPEPLLFSVSSTGLVVYASGEVADSVNFLRTYEIPEDGYVLKVTDRLVNNREGSDCMVPGYTVALGSMDVSGAGADMTDVAVDAKVQLSGSDKAKVENFDTRYISEMFGGTAGGCSRARVSPYAPMSESRNIPGTVYWVAARDRFFVQMLIPEASSRGFGVAAERLPSDASGALRISGIAASAAFDGMKLGPGETAERSYEYYAGPRKMSNLRPLTKDALKVMSFGTWRIFCEWLLDLLNFIERIVPGGYGMAIIVLTVLVRLLLYPINKRNAESMRKMSKIQPLIKEVNDKYANDPQKKQQEIMRIYGENKVNPLSSCLPMLIQLPIFIALFTILRSSVELRFAPFLWVADLSAPENLFRDAIGFGVNILPLTMAGTMALQSYLTPTAGDPAQQRMMMIIMPVMMLVMFYQLPSALCLYWTVSQILAIFGLLWNRRKNKSGDESGAEVLPPPRETRQMRRHGKKE